MCLQWLDALVTVSLGHPRNGTQPHVWIRGIIKWLQKFIIMDMSEGSLEVKLPTVWRDGNAEVGRVREEKRREEKRREGKRKRKRKEKRKGREEKGKGREREEKKREERREEERRSEKRKSQKKEDAGAWKGRKVAIHYVSSMICGPGGSKSRLAKAAGAGPSGQVRDEKMYAVVARSTFPSQNAQCTQGSDHFWTLRCWKSALRCGAKHVWKSKCTKHTKFGPLLEDEMSKKCTVLARSTFPSQKYKAHQLWSTFWSWDVEKVHAVVPRSNAKHISKSKVPKTDGYGALLDVQM